MAKTRVALYGDNGHQIAGKLRDHPTAELTAVAGIARDALPEPLRTVRRHDSLDALLADDQVELVSLCSPRRADQAADAIRAIGAGKHVYAEKPAALNEEDLDAILAAAERAGRVFHEMAGTAFEAPYYTMRQLVADGAIGQVVQVFVQKSYPLHNRRPQDEAIDGGLTLQVGVHAARLVEHVGGAAMTEIAAAETQLGNRDAGDLRIAVSMIATLANGGVAALICNYLNPDAFGMWGNEHLRIFGTEGLIESVDGGRRTRLVLNGADYGELIPASPPSVDFFDLVLADVRGEEVMPLSLAEELHPLRMVIRAKPRANANGPDSVTVP